MALCLAAQRVRERVLAGGHEVPEPVIRRRYHRGIKNFFEIYRALATTWAVYDNSSSAGPVLVATGHGFKAPTVQLPGLWYTFWKAKK